MGSLYPRFNLGEKGNAGAVHSCGLFFGEKDNMSAVHSRGLIFGRRTVDELSIAAAHFLEKGSGIALDNCG